jgi:hypothetical protein
MPIQPEPRKTLPIIKRNRLKQVSKAFSERVVYFIMVFNRELPGQSRYVFFEDQRDTATGQAPDGNVPKKQACQLISNLSN